MAVLAVALGIVLSTLIYGNIVRFGFDDLRILIIPFAGIRMEMDASFIAKKSVVTK